MAKSCQKKTLNQDVMPVVFPFNLNKIPPEAYLPNNLYEHSQLTEAKYTQGKCINFDQDTKRIDNPFLKKSGKPIENTLQPNQTDKFSAISNVKTDFVV